MLSLRLQGLSALSFHGLVFKTDRNETLQKGILSWWKLMEDCNTASCLCEEVCAPETLYPTKLQSVKMKSSIQFDLFCCASLEHKSEKNLHV